jgi:hypothetical protein
VQRTGLDETPHSIFTDRCAERQMTAVANMEGSLSVADKDSFTKKKKGRKMKSKHATMQISKTIGCYFNRSMLVLPAQLSP